MRTSDDRAVIDWLIGLFPVVPRRGTRLAFMFTDLEGFTAHAAVRGNGAALMLRRFQGLGYADIAASLGGNEAAARANVYQAVKRLRAALEDEP